MRKLIVAIAVTVAALSLGAIGLGLLTPSQAAGPENCPADTSCSVGQTLSLTIVEPGAQPPVVKPTDAAKPIDEGGTKPDQGGAKPDQGGASKPNAGGGGTELSETGPRETLILGLVGLGVLQLGLILTVRSVRATPRIRPAR